MKILEKINKKRVKSERLKNLLISTLSLSTICSLAITSSFIFTPDKQTTSQQIANSANIPTNNLSTKIKISDELARIHKYEDTLKSKHKALLNILSSIDAIDVVKPEPFAIGGEPDPISKKLEKQASLIKELPIGTPLIGEISSNYGYRISPFTKKKTMHAGIDIKNREHSNVQSTADGTVSFAGVKGGYGNLVEIDHGKNLKTLYAHLSKIKVKEGQKVCRDQIIGLVGSTGRSTGPHLHYEVRKFNIHQNPKNFIDAANLLKLAVDS